MMRHVDVKCAKFAGEIYSIFAYYSPIPIVKMFFQETMMRYDVCFLQGSTLIGTHWEFTDAEKIIGLMEAGRRGALALS
jgi:hypothetical protein